jgi:hypothetical protein
VSEIDAATLVLRPIGRPAELVAYEALADSS